MPDYEEELRSATEAVLQSAVTRKLVVAGPGAGKTFLFRQFLERNGQPRNLPLVLTFINTLKNDLDRELGSLSHVSTFHGYCRSLLHRYPPIRDALTVDFEYFPPLPSLIKDDWQISRGTAAPHFIGLMRTLTTDDALDFYLERANFYDAVSFDDSVFRAYEALRRNPEEVEAYDLVLVDEYQDFNRLEAEFISLLAERSPIVIAGDDDQALYATLRSSTPKFIRELFASDSFGHFPLPYCMRCTEVVVEAVNDIVAAAVRRGHLSGRIDKPYRFYPPKKAADSIQYPLIKIVETSVQRNGTANYFGRYIAEQIALISEEEVKESREGGWPTALIIGPRQYTRQIQECLEDQGYRIETSGDQEGQELSINDGLHILKKLPESNLGWRVVLEIDRPPCFEAAIRASVDARIPLARLLPDEYMRSVLDRVGQWQEEAPEETSPSETEHSGPIIKMVSFEGSKGLSASHVFIVGLHEGDLPRNPAHTEDLEICKFLVALTRTRKQCHILYTRRWGANFRRPSAFLSWIRPQRKQLVHVDSRYWTNAQ